MNELKLKELAKSLMLELRDDEMSLISKKFELFLKQVDQINDIDTKGVTPLDYPFENEFGKLRDDISGNVLSVKEVLSNAADTSMDMVKIPKVILW